MSSKLEDLRQKHSEILSAIRAAESEELRTVTLPIMKAMIGCTFKYHNSYSHGDKWWMYVVLTGVNYDTFEALEIQKDSDARIIVRSTQMSFPISIGYLPISREEFDKETKPILAELAKAVKTKVKAK